LPTLAEQGESASQPAVGGRDPSYRNRTRSVSAETVRENYERIRGELGPDVTIVAATKYVELEDLQALAEAGIEVVGENRAQDLEAKHALHGDAFRWHFIGHLQSRKAKTVNELCELCHSLASESAARRLAIPALVEVNLSGEESKSGIPESRLEEFLALYDDVRGLMTMPPETGDAEASRPYFKRLRQLAERNGLRELSMGTSQDYRVAADEGATIVRLGSVLYGR
jgi:PLP dependent protein